MPVISAQGIGKAYRRYPSQWARAREWLFRIRSHEERWVLRDVTLNVEAGAAIGIVGPNGAGKSTLLKIISRATNPTEGVVNVEGRVAALLELGMGFHPDFTGRQNALMSGQILGLELSEVEHHMPAIEQFADIGDFLDQPIRTYSSGMQMRLAFSVATAVRPDVLIVDEALSVGDAVFQRKCYQRIESFRQQGTAMLFVSHDIEAVKRLCDEAIFLDQGSVKSQGPVRSVCDAYERAIFGGEAVQESSEGAVDNMRSSDEAGALYDGSLVTTCEQVYGSGEAEIESCWLESVDGQVMNVLSAGSAFRWCFVVRFHEAIHSPVFSMMLKTGEGQAVFGTDSQAVGPAPTQVQEDERLRVSFELQAPLASGDYFLNCGVRQDSDGESVFLSRRVDAGLLRVRSAEASSALVGATELWATLRVDDIDEAG